MIDVKDKTIQELLNIWKGVLKGGQERSKARVESVLVKHPCQKINRTSGSPVVFDRVCSKEQRSIQKILCGYMPEHQNLITSEPALTGYLWKMLDYVELYFNHYYLVIAKLEEVIGNASAKK